MQPDKIIVLITGILGICFTYWFFFMKKDTVKTVEDSVDIVVEGGYSPSSISITQGKPTHINFIRKDPSSCLEEIVIPEFKIRRFLPLNEKVTITVTPSKSGEFSMSCGMNMFHGKIIVT